jgi:hypothetical protein
MVIRFNLSVNGDPSFPGKTDMKTIRGFTNFSHEKNFRTLDLTTKEARIIFDRTQDYLDTQLAAFIPKEK